MIRNLTAVLFLLGALAFIVFVGVLIWDYILMSLR